MNIVDSLMTIKDFDELFIELLKGKSDRDWTRYEPETVILGCLAEYALNKEKNKCKPNFENLFSCDIFTIFESEVKELQHEIIQDKIDPRKAFEEIADCAAVLVGLLANLRDTIKRAK